VYIKEEMGITEEKNSFERYTGGEVA